MSGCVNDGKRIADGRDGRNREAESRMSAGGKRRNGGCRRRNAHYVETGRRSDPLRPVLGGRNPLGIGSGGRRRAVRPSEKLRVRGRNRNLFPRRGMRRRVVTAVPLRRRHREGRLQRRIRKNQGRAPVDRRR